MGDDRVARSSLDTELWGAYDWRRMPAGGIYLSLVCTYGRSIPSSGEYRANYIFLVSLSPRMKVALFPSHKIDTYTYE